MERKFKPFHQYQQIKQSSLTPQIIEYKKRCQHKPINKLEKKYAPALDNYGQSCFVKCDFFFNKVPPPDHKKL